MSEKFISYDNLKQYDEFLDKELQDIKQHVDEGFTFNVKYAESDEIGGAAIKAVSDETGENIAEHFETVEKNIEDIVTNVTATGTAVVLDDLQGDVPFSEIEVQDINLLYNTLASQTSNGITYTKNDDGSVSLSGTATGDTWFKFASKSIILNKGEYIFGYDGTFITDGITDSYYYFVRYGSTEKWYNICKENDVKNATLSVEEDNTPIAIGIRVTTGDTVDCTIYPYLNRAESGLTEYVSPIIGKETELTVCGKNLLPSAYTPRTSTSVTSTIDENGIVTVNTVNPNSGNQDAIYMNENVLVPVNVLNNPCSIVITWIDGIMDVSSSTAEEVTSYGWLGIRGSFFDKDKNSISSTSFYKYTKGYKGLNLIATVSREDFAIPENAVYFGITLWIPGNTYCKDFRYTLHIELGDTATEFEPYYGYTKTFTPTESPFVITENLKQYEGTNTLMVSAGEMFVAGVKENAALNNVWEELDTKLTHTILTTNTDLDTLKTTGIYTMKVACTNTPTTVYGTIYVDFNIGTPYQLYVTDGGADLIFYKRKYISSSDTWGDWKTYNPTQVTQNLRDTNPGNYPLLLAPSGQTATTTTGVCFDSGVTLNPSTNTITANINGIATQATSDGNNENIAEHFEEVETKIEEALARNEFTDNEKTKLSVTNIGYGTSSTAAATAEKVITLTGNDNWELKPGSIVVVKFSATNTAQNPKLNVNGTGAKSVWYNTAVITTSGLGYAGTANRPMKFVYDGANYIFMGWSSDIDTNTKYTNAALGHGYGICTTAAATVAKTATLSGYTLTANGIVAIKFDEAVPAGATLNINGKGAKAIYHKGAAIKSEVIGPGDIAVFIYSGQYHLLAINSSIDSITEINTKIADIESELQAVDKKASYTSGTGISIAADNTINHTNSVTAATASGSSSKTLAFSGTFTIPTVTYDAQGHITNKGTTTMTMPANPNTHYASKNVVGSATATSNTTTALTNGNVYLNSVENGAVTSAHKISGSGTTTVTTDASGNIIINSTDTDTKVTQTVKSDSANYPLLLAPSGQTTTKTTTACFDSGVTLNPSTNTIAANISGIAAKATSDKNGKDITTTYLPLAGGTMDTGSTITIPGSSGRTLVLKEGGLKITLPTNGAASATGMTYANSNGTELGNIAGYYDENQALKYFYMGTASSPLFKVDGSGSGTFKGDITVTKGLGGKVAVTNADQTQEVRLHWGSGGENRGIWDTILNKWALKISNTSVELDGNAASATKLATARTLEGISFNGTAATTHFAVCNTAAATAAKEATLTGFNLVVGARVILVFTNGNSADEITLNISSTGAKPVYYANAKMTNRTLSIQAGVGYEFIYAGDIWVYCGNALSTEQSNTTTNASYRLLLSKTADNNVDRGGTKKSANFTANPSTGVLTAKSFKSSGGTTPLATGSVTAANFNGSTGSPKTLTITVSNLSYYSTLYLELGNVSEGYITGSIPINYLLNSTSNSIYLQASLIEADWETCWCKVTASGNNIYINSPQCTAANYYGFFTNALTYKVFKI